MAELKCLKCGNSINQGAKFCAECGTPVIPPIHKPGQPAAPQKAVPQKPIRQAPQRPVAQQAHQAVPQPQQAHRPAPRRKKSSPWGKILALTGGGILIAVCCVVLFAGLTMAVLFADIDLDISGTGGSSGGGGDIISSEPMPPDALATQQMQDLPDIEDMVMTLTAVPGE